MLAVLPALISSAALTTAAAADIRQEWVQENEAPSLAAGIWQIPGILVSWGSDSANDGVQTASREGTFTTDTWVGAGTSAIGVLTSCPVLQAVGCVLGLTGLFYNEAYRYYGGMYHENTALLDRQAGRTVAAIGAAIANGSWGFCAGAPNTPAHYCCSYSVQYGEYCYCAGCGDPSEAAGEPGAEMEPARGALDVLGPHGDAMTPVADERQLDNLRPAHDALPDSVGKALPAVAIVEPLTTSVTPVEAGVEASDAGVPQGL